MKSKFLLVFLTVLVPAYLVNPIPIQAQEDDSPITPPSLQVSNGGLHDLPLKAIKHPDGEIDTQEDFEIQPDNIITVTQSSDFHVLPNGGAVEAVKITDDALQTTDLVFSVSTGRVSQDLAPKAYLLDIIVLMENDDRYLYETVMTVLAPGQTLNQVNIQNIIQSFVSTRSDTHTTVIFEDDNEPPDEEEPSICYFEPNTAPECKPLPDGSCPNGMVHNDDGNCHPGGQCPDGYGRVDDDETGTCYPDDETIECDNGAVVLREEDCAIYDPNPPPDPRQVCYFEPNNEVCNPDEDGNCLEGMGFNDDGQCIPQGPCPEGNVRLDDDETGRCFAEGDTKVCPPNNIRVEITQPCPTVPAPAAEADNDTSTEEEAEPEPECEPNFILENGVCTEMTSNCGGEPCTPSQKEDSTTSDVIPGEPHTPTTDTEPEPPISESEETVAEIEEQEEQDAESNGEDNDSSDNDNEDEDENEEEQD